MILASVSLDAPGNTLIFSVDCTRTIEQISFANRGGGAVLLRLWIVPFDTALANEHAWLYNKSLAPSSTALLLEHNFTLSLGEQIWAYTSVAGVSVNVAGS